MEGVVADGVLLTTVGVSSACLFDLECWCPCTISPDAAEDVSEDEGMSPAAFVRRRHAAVSFAVAVECRLGAHL